LGNAINKATSREVLITCACLTFSNTIYAK
ncbi:MAG: hypothetical protein ACI81G_000296, partial [Gammaproteobacteria bacterium]